MHASNFYLRVIGNNEEQLDAILAAALDEHTVESWAEHDGWLILYWSKEIDDVHRLPFKEGLNSVRHIVKKWLSEQKIDESTFPQFDGSVSEDGWEVVAGWGAVTDALDSKTPSDRNIDYEVLRVAKRYAFYAK